MLQNQGNMPASMAVYVNRGCATKGITHTQLRGRTVGSKAFFFDVAVGLAGPAFCGFEEAFAAFKPGVWALILVLPEAIAAELEPFLESNSAWAVHNLSMPWQERSSQNDETWTDTHAVQPIGICFLTGLIESFKKMDEQFECQAEAKKHRRRSHVHNDYRSFEITLRLTGYEEMLDEAKT